MHRRGWALVALLAASVSPASADGAGPPVAVAARPGIDATVLRRVREIAASRRAVRDELAPPEAGGASAERAAAQQRIGAARLALERARARSSEAAWDDCVREASGVLGDAIEAVTALGDFALLRDLHLQIGVCLTLAQSPASARPHFLAAALLDEEPGKPGQFREEAERAQTDARAEVVARARGRVRVETDPPGAAVWIDGRRAATPTPADVDVRLGDHYVTLRRFRYDTRTERRVLTPGSTARFALEPARRAALGEQLAALSDPRAQAAPDATPRPRDDEIRLARAAWSRAEQLVLLAPGGASAVRIEILDAATGAPIRRTAAAGLDDAALRRAVCDALGEVCEAPSRGIPWYVWPIAGAAIVGGVVTTALIAINDRDVRVCGPSGCR